MFFLASIVSCSSPLQISSSHVESPITIDGKSEDWTDVLQRAQDPGILYAIRNDDKYLYLCIIPMDQPIGRQMLMRGFTVWFDPDGGKEKCLGIKFPLGMDGVLMQSLREGKRDDPMKEFDKEMVEHLREFEILGPGKYDLQRLTRKDRKPVQVCVGLTEKRLVYELKFPLYSADDEHGIDPAKNSLIGIGLQTSEMRGNPGQMNRGMGDGGMGGGAVGAVKGGMSGRRSGGPMMERPKPLDFWAKVKLISVEK